MKKIMIILGTLVISLAAFGNVEEMTKQCRGAVIDFKCYGDKIRYETNTCDAIHLIRKNLISTANVNLLGIEDMDLTAYRQGRDRPTRNHGIFYSQNGAACAEAIAKSIKEFAANSYQEKYQKAPHSELYLDTSPLSEAYSGFLKRTLFPNSAKESAEHYANSINENGPYVVIYWSKNQFINADY